MKRNRMPGINNTLASQGTGVYQHKVLDCISYFGQECLKKSCAKTGKNQNAGYITSNKIYYEGRQIMYIKLLTAIKYSLYSLLLEEARWDYKNKKKLYVYLRERKNIVQT
jgi:hypothetical protein